VLYVGRSFAYPHGIKVTATDAEATLEYGILKCELRITDWGQLATKHNEVVKKVAESRHTKALARATKMVTGQSALPPKVKAGAPATTTAAPDLTPVPTSSVALAVAKTASAQAAARKEKRKHEQIAAALLASQSKSQNKQNRAAANGNDDDNDDDDDDADADGEGEDDTTNGAANGEAKPKRSNRQKKADRKLRRAERRKAARAHLQPGATGATGATGAAEDGADAEEDETPRKRQKTINTEPIVGRNGKVKKAVDPNAPPRKKKVFPDANAALAIADSINATVDSKISRALQKEVSQPINRSSKQSPVFWAHSTRACNCD
jgi:hypothetical protein